MKTAVIYYSRSGITRSVAEEISMKCQADLFEVTPKKPYSLITSVLFGTFRAIKGICDPVIPEKIDLQAYDQVVFCSPVWAGHATPVIHGGIEACTGETGKRAFAVVTCGGEAGNALRQMRARLEKRGFVVAGEKSLNAKELKTKEALSSLIEQILPSSG